MKAGDERQRQLVKDVASMDGKIGLLQVIGWIVVAGIIMSALQPLFQQWLFGGLVVVQVAAQPSDREV